MTGTMVNHNDAIGIADGVFFTQGTLTKNCFMGNGIGVFDLDGGSSVSGNWWGSPDGPSGIGTGAGDAYALGSGTPMFLPFLTVRPSCPAVIVP
jgi:hypothetical protein